MRKYWGVPFLAVGLCAAQALAADLPTEKPAPAPIPEPVLPSTWRFEATLDGFAPSLNASMGVRNLPTLPVYASIFKILPRLEGYVPVSVVAYSDNFIVGAGLFWVRLGVGGTFTPGEGAFGGVNAGVVLNQTVATTYGGVRIPTPSPDWSIYGILGARYFNLNATINLQIPVAGFSRSRRKARIGPTRS
jgi:hypothetical protein